MRFPCFKAYFLEVTGPTMRTVRSSDPRPLDIVTTTINKTVSNLNIYLLLVHTPVR
jgi:hypothetical protein